MKSREPQFELKTSQQTIGYCPKVVGVHSSVQQYFTRHSHRNFGEQRIGKTASMAIIWLDTVSRVPWLFLAWLYLLLRTRYGRPRQSTNHAKSTSAHARDNALSKKSRLYITLRCGNAIWSVNSKWNPIWKCISIILKFSSLWNRDMPSAVDEPMQRSFFINVNKTKRFITWILQVSIHGPTKYQKEKEAKPYKTILGGPGKKIRGGPHTLRQCHVYVIEILSLFYKSHYLC